MALLREGVKDKAFEVLKNREFAFANDCFQNESNAVFGVFLQRLSLFLFKIDITTIQQHQHYGNSSNKTGKHIQRN